MADKLPAGAANFHIAFGSLATGTFTSCTGVAAQTSVVDYNGSGTGGKAVLQKLYGPPKPGEITIKRAVVPGDTQFSAWAKKVEGGDTSARVNGTIKVVTATGDPVVTFSVTNAWVSGYTLGDLVAGSNTLLEETVTLTHEGVTVS